MGLKGKIEAIIYAAEEPINLDQVAFLVKEQVLQEMAAEQERAAAEASEGAADEAAQREQLLVQADVVGAEQPATESSDAANADATAESAKPASEDAVQGGTTPSGQSEPDAPPSEPDNAQPPHDPTQATADDAVPPEPVLEEPGAEASEKAKPATSPKRKKNEVPSEVKTRVRELIQELVVDYANNDRGMEIRQIAGGYRMTTKPEHHDIVKAFAKSLKPPLRLSLPALETLAVVAYKQPVTAPEVSDIRGVESQGVMATLLERKLITTAGRKAVIGRPILYKTTKEFLLRFGLNNTAELPSIEEFEKLAQEQNGLFISEGENEPTLSPEEATARLEQASAEAEAAADSTGEIENASSEQATPTTAEAGADTQTVAPEASNNPEIPEETHQS